MTFEPFLIFFLVWRLRKTLRKSSTLPEWDRMLTMGLYFIGILAVVQLVPQLQFPIMWLCRLLLIGIIWMILKKPEFQSLRTMTIAFIPLVAISVAVDLLRAGRSEALWKIADYLDYANPLAFAWMIAMLIISSKQQKALEKERKIREDEEREARIVAARKAELEVMVAERTAELTKQKEELEEALIGLKNTQAQLIQAEKMASLGELTAGIAHEIQNPLNFVNNFSEVSAELIGEMEQELDKGNRDDAVAIAEDIKSNLQKILHHGKRADSIVKGMLQHSRSSSGQKEPTDINALADEYLRLSYHGLRAKDKSFNAAMQTSFDETIEEINVIRQDLGRVFINLFNNAFYAVTEKKKQIAETGRADTDYKPTVFVSTKKINGGVEIHIKDNGTGIPERLFDKIFQPFFTTKPPGQGVGLGLSLSYDIITKAHGGTIRVETKEDEGTEFIIELR